MTDGFSLFQILIALTAFAALAYAGSLWYRRHQRRVLKVVAEVSSEIADAIDELDLDLRLGKDQFITIDLPIESGKTQSVRVAYRQTGEGPDLLCLHGIGASSIIYRRMGPKLRKKYRVTCLDFPGFGMSDKPQSLNYGLDQQAEALRLAIQALKLDRPLVVASSMGGAISLWAATQNSKLMRGLVTVAPAVEPQRIPVFLLPLSRFGNRLHGLGRTGAVDTVVRQVMSRSELITPKLVDLYRAPYMDAGDSSSAFLKALSLLADRRIPGVFRELKTPLLITLGLQDRLVRRVGCERLQKIVPGATFLTHPTAGHHVMEDEPEWLQEQIEAFDQTLVASKN